MITGSLHFPTTGKMNLSLCTKVQYATAGLDQQLFVSRYLVALPKPEELQALIERDQAVFEEAGKYHSHVTFTCLN
jgi:methylaspartate ammonia-lyase